MVLVKARIKMWPRSLAVWVVIGLVVQVAPCQAKHNDTLVRRRRQKRKAIDPSSLRVAVCLQMHPKQHTLSHPPLGLSEGYEGVIKREGVRGRKATPRYAGEGQMQAGVS
jgi:hypothetical protein